MVGIVAHLGIPLLCRFFSARLRLEEGCRRGRQHLRVRCNRHRERRVTSRQPAPILSNKTTLVEVEGIAGEPRGCAGTGPEIEGVMACCRHRNRLRVRILPAPLASPSRRTAAIGLIANKISSGGAQPDLLAHTAVDRFGLHDVWRHGGPKEFLCGGDEFIGDWLELVVNGNGSTLTRDIYRLRVGLPAQNEERK
jgi:hypothetical protein